MSWWAQAGDGGAANKGGNDDKDDIDHVDDDFNAFDDASDEEDDDVGQVNQYKKRGDVGGNRGEVDTDGEDEEKEQLPGMSGWVDKCTPACFIPLQRRFLRLENKQLRWFADDSIESRVLGHLDLDLIDVTIQRQYGEKPAASRTKTCCMGRKAGSISELLMGPEKRASFTICPVGSRRVVEMCLPTESEAEAWVSCLELHEKHSMKLGSSGGKVVQMDDWWRTSRVTPEQFEKIANTGDVLLFRSKGTMPRLIRLASGSKGRYDHVGLIVKLSGSQIGILEATGGEGVGLVTWQEFIDNGWNDLYPELALRRVHFQRSKERLKKMQEWINETLGKPYDLNLSKLTVRSSVGAVGQESYFCSELCAKALKVLGVLPEEKASAQYWPSTFSAQMPPIPCNEGCRFDQADLVIDFNLAEDPSKYKRKDKEGKQRDATTNWG